MRNIAWPGWLLCFLAGWWFAASVQAVTLRDDRGVASNWERPPQRIVSLLPSLTEAVCALGRCERLVGVDRFSNWPEQVRSLPKLGGLDDAQIEPIVALRPDVVLAAPSARVIGRLESLGLKVVVIDSRAHADVQRGLMLLGQLLDAQAQANMLWMNIERALRDASHQVPFAMRRKRVYFEIDSTPYAAGAGSFVGQTLSAMGLGNVATKDMGPFPRLNSEFVVRAQPDIVMASRANIDDMAHRPGWNALAALRQRRLCAFDPASYELITRPGPRMGEAALALADCLVGLEKAP